MQMCLALMQCCPTRGPPADFKWPAWAG